MAAALLLALFRRSFLRADTDAFDLHPRQFSAMSHGAMITFTPFKSERDYLLVFPLLDDFGGNFCT
jgi:hypothetical protein